MNKELVERLAKLIAAQVMKWLVSKAAFFSFGPVGALTSLLIQCVVGKALEVTFLGAMIAYINFDTKRDLNAVEKLLKEISEHEGELTQEDKKQYDKKLAKASRELIRFGTV